MQQHQQQKIDDQKDDSHVGQGQHPFPEKNLENGRQPSETEQG